MWRMRDMESKRVGKKEQECSNAAQQQWRNGEMEKCSDHSSISFSFWPGGRDTGRMINVVSIQMAAPESMLQRSAGHLWHFMWQHQDYQHFSCSAAGMLPTCKILYATDSRLRSCQQIAAFPDHQIATKLHFIPITLLGQVIRLIASTQHIQLIRHTATSRCKTCKLHSIRTAVRSVGCCSFN